MRRVYRLCECVNLLLFWSSEITLCILTYKCITSYLFDQYNIYMDMLLILESSVSLFIVLVFYLQNKKKMLSQFTSVVCD